MANNADFFQVFGHISVFFATWDMFTALLIVRLVRPECEIPPSNSTLGKKLMFLERLNDDQVVNPELLTRIQTDLPDSKEVSRKRNRFIHDQWVFEPTLIAQDKIKRCTLRMEQNMGIRFAPMDQEEYHITDLYKFLETVGEQQKKYFGFAQELPETTLPPQKTT